MIENTEQIVNAFIKKHEMISEGDKVIVGVSGGADSVCLLYILYRLKKTIDFELYAVHVNHMLRGAEARRDKEFVKKFCEYLGVQCMVANIDVKTLAANSHMSVEEAGRMARYLSFDAAAKKISRVGEYNGAKVALAHHRDDNAETVLLNLVRGSSINGLKGILPVNTRDKLTLIRPLLCIGREDIDRYLSHNEIPHVEDSTNASDEYARNKIRLNVIPELKNINPRAVEHIGDAMEDMAMVQDFLDRQVEEAMGLAVDKREDSVAVRVRELKELDPVLQTRVVYKSIGLMAGKQKDITHIHVRDVLGLTDKQTGRKIELPYDLIATRSYSNIIITKKGKPEPSQRKDYEDSHIHDAFYNAINISLTELQDGPKQFGFADGGALEFRLADVNDQNRSILTAKNLYTKAFDCDKIRGNLILGGPQPGDEITFAGGTKTLKKYFTDEKIPKEMRDDMLILKDTDSVLWVVGYRMGEKYKITGTTRRVLLVSIIGGENGQ